MMPISADRLFAKIFKDRQYALADRKFWHLIETYTRTEWMILRIFYGFTFFVALTTTLLAVTFDFNETRLFVLNFCLSLTDCKTFSLIWILNFSYQLIVVVVSILVFSAYFGVIFMLMSHACFKVDVVIETVKGLKTFCDHEKMNAKYWRIYNRYFIKKQMQQILIQSLDTKNFIEEAQSYMEISIFTELIILGLVICTTIFSISKSATGSMICLACSILSTVLLFVYNFAGQQLQNKLDELVEAVYSLPWYNLHFRDQKDFLFILMSLQKFRGFHGIFFYLSHETFHQVGHQKDFMKSLKICLFCRFPSRHTRCSHFLSQDSKKQTTLLVC